MRLTTIHVSSFLAVAAMLSPIAAQAPVPTDASPTPDAAQTAELVAKIPVRELRDGTLADGIITLRRLAESGEVQAARVSADILLAPRGVASMRLAWWNEGGEFVRALLDATGSLTEPLGWNGRPESERAQVLIERGLVSLAPEERPMAEHDFGRALAVAPSGELRAAAAYDLALLPLLEGEEWRAQIPELGGTPPPAAPPANGAAPEEPPDPLERAKAAYLEARARFIERLKLDWRDADTRANVELIQRRLRELAEIEQQREEQQQQQEQQDQQQDGEENQDQQDQDSEQQDEQQQPEDGEQEPQDGEQGDEQEEPDEPQDGEESPEESEGEEQREQQAEPQEVHLSQEELQRLLNRLAEHEKQAEALREMQRERGSRGVDKDW